MEAGVCPRRNPGHGMSDPQGALRICQESYPGTPHVEFVLGLTKVVLGMAIMYLCDRDVV